MATKKTKYRDVVCNKYVSAEGYNRKFEDFDPSAHAEVVAIRNAGKALRTPCRTTGMHPIYKL